MMPIRSAAMRVSVADVEIVNCLGAVAICVRIRDAIFGISRLPSQAARSIGLIDGLCGERCEPLTLRMLI